MKKITKLFVGALFVASSMMMFTSCIDNAVAPEVTQLRQAQVAYLQAQTRLQDAEAAAAEIQNALDEALNAIAIQQAESDLAVTLAENEAAVLQAQADLEEARLELEEAIDEFNAYLAENGLDEAADYLDLYSDAKGDAFDTQEDIITLIAEIARDQAIIDADSFGIFALELQRDLDVANASLTFKESELETLQAIAADPSAIQTTLNGVKQELSEAQVERDLLLVDQAEAQLAADQAADDLAQAEQFITDYETAEDKLEAAQEAQDNIQEQIDDLNAQIAADEDELQPYQDELDARTGPYNTALATAQDLLDDWIQAQNEFEAVDVNFNPGDAEYDDALTARDDAQTAFEDFAGDYGNNPDSIDLENDGTDAGSDFAEAKDPFDAIAAEFAREMDGTPSPGAAAAVLEDAIEAAELAIFDPKGPGSADDEGLQVDLAVEENNEVEAEATIARLQADYDDAIANIDALEAADLEATNTLADITTDVAILDARVANLTTQETSLEALLDDEGNIASIAATIDGVEDEIETLRQNIQAAAEALADNEINLEEAEALIANKEADLARLQEELAAYEALAAEYLALFNAALEG